MFDGAPNAQEIVGTTRTTTGTLVTVPAGKWLTANVTLSASLTLAGTSTPTISTLGTNAAPASGSVIHRINVVGLALATISDSCSTSIIVLAPDENDVTVEFTAGAAGTSSASISGFIFG